MSFANSGSAPFIIWWSGTAGQAEWLKYFSESLRSDSRVELMPSSGADLPHGLRPLFALEHPDLVVSDSEGNALLSIEITEQAAFGTNSQQRMARMWSAVANSVPAAYLLPIESYQIDLDGTKRGHRLLAATNPSLALFADSVPGLTVAMCRANGANSPEEVLLAIENDEFVVPSEKMESIYNFVHRHVLNGTKSYHLPIVPPHEAYHDVGERSFRAYLRRPGIPESMVLMWMHACSQTSPAFAFQMLRDLHCLFETNGTPHLLDYPDAPWLAYQNLPLPPGHSKVVHRESGMDEMGHFFHFVDDAVNQTVSGDYYRSNFVAPNEYFDAGVLDQWRKTLEDDVSMDAAPSGDYRLPTERFLDLVASDVLNDGSEAYLAESLFGIGAVNVLRMVNSTAARSLADPYSGMLATRDILFCRDGDASSVKSAFANRKEALVFWCEMRGDACTKHPFLGALVWEQVRRRHLEVQSLSLQDAVISILQSCSPDEIPKSLRVHLIMSDAIVVQRSLQESTTFEFVLGLPALLRLGRLADEVPSLRGLYV